MGRMLDLHVASWANCSSVISKTCRVIPFYFTANRFSPHPRKKKAIGEPLLHVQTSVVMVLPWILSHWSTASPLRCLPGRAQTADRKEMKPRHLFWDWAKRGSQTLTRPDLKGTLGVCLKVLLKEIKASSLSTRLKILAHFGECWSNICWGTGEFSVLTFDKPPPVSSRLWVIG